MELQHKHARDMRSERDKQGRLGEQQAEALKQRASGIEAEMQRVAVREQQLAGGNEELMRERAAVSRRCERLEQDELEAARTREDIGTRLQKLEEREKDFGRRQGRLEEEYKEFERKKKVIAAGGCAAAPGAFMLWFKHGSNELGVFLCYGPILRRNMYCRFAVGFGSESYCILRFSEVF